MKSSVFARISKYNKWLDVVSLSTIECRMGLMFAVIMLLLAYYLDVYNSIDVFLVPMQNITLFIATTLFGMIGIILAGLAIVIGKLDHNVVKLIDKLNGKNTTERMLVSFEYLAFNIGVQVMAFLMIYFILFSPKPLVCEFLFYVIFGFISYWLSFTLFYIISIMSNVIKIFHITNTYNEILVTEKNVYEEANEIRIDFLLHSLLKDDQREEFLNKLFDFVDASNISNKDVVKKYLAQYYSIR
ncbi:MAG: hypothetical protein K9L17_10315 [Clostridiales bacterium]|nr:hypothetical protein [Clostridiales bacterium]MCF8023075.1 hypothetical protein [Clostridiales bacterium]